MLTPPPAQVIPPHYIVATAVAGIEIARSYRRRLEMKVLSEGVPSVSSTSMSHVDVQRATNLADAALRSINRIADEIDVRACQQLLTTYSEELRGHSDSLGRVALDPIDAQEMKQFEGIELEDNSRLCLFGWLFNRQRHAEQEDDWKTYIDDATGVTYYYSRRRNRTTWTEQNTGIRPDQSDWDAHTDEVSGARYYHSQPHKRTTWSEPAFLNEHTNRQKIRRANSRGSTLGGSLRSKVVRAKRESLLKKRVLLGSLPNESIHEYVCEQRFINGAFPRLWQRTLYRVLLQQHRLPKTLPAIHKLHGPTPAASGQMTCQRLLCLLLCITYCFSTTIFVFAFHLRQETKRGADANHAVYCAVIVDTMINIMIVSPVGLFIQLILLPNIATLLLRSNSEAYFAKQRGAALGANNGWTKAAGIAKAKRRFEVLLARAKSRSESEEAKDDGEWATSPVHEDGGDSRNQASGIPIDPVPTTHADTTIGGGDDDDDDRGIDLEDIYTNRASLELGVDPNPILTGTGPADPGATADATDHIELGKIYTSRASMELGVGHNPLHDPTLRAAATGPAVPSTTSGDTDGVELGDIYTSRASLELGMYHNPLRDPTLCAAATATGRAVSDTASGATNHSVRMNGAAQESDRRVGHTGAPPRFAVPNLHERYGGPIPIFPVGDVVLRTARLRTRKEDDGSSRVSL